MKKKTLEDLTWEERFWEAFSALLAMECRAEEAEARYQRETTVSVEDSLAHEAYVRELYRKEAERIDLERRKVRAERRKVTEASLTRAQQKLKERNRAHSQRQRDRLAGRIDD
jgi:ABC-type uncharacterized transport system substrate-binding protein